jgi:3-oxoacyl-[acyl-carrier-protein] synthase I
VRAEGVIVAAAEACTALGLDLATTALEIEAGTSRFEDTPLMDATDEPVRAARLTALPPGASRARRMATLAVTALLPVIEQVQRAGLDRVGLFLGLPGDLPAAAASRVLQALWAAAAPVQITLPKRGAHAMGRASAFFALQEAMELIATGGRDGALVGAIDCLCDTVSLATASGRGELLSPTNIEGLLPGEGAGFVWLLSERWPVPRGLAPGRLLAVATGHEPRHLAQPQPNLGEGLTVVLRSLRRHPRAGEVRVDRLLSCQTDQGYWSTELTWGYLRNAALCPEPFEPRRLTAALGDTGAASGAIALALAARATAGMGPGRRTLVLGGSDTGERGACVVLAGEPIQWPRPPTPRAMPRSGPPSLREHELAPPFLQGLHNEHLEELGILLELRCDILRDPGVGWLEAADVEERIAAHLRAWAHEAADPLVPPDAAREALTGDDPERAAGAALALSGRDEAEVLAGVAEALVGLEPAEHPRWLDALAWRGRASATAVACFGRLLEAPQPAHAELGLRVLDGWAACDTPRALAWLDTLEPGSEAHDLALLHVAQWGDEPRAVETRLQGMPIRGPVIEAALWVGQRAPLLALRIRLQQGYPLEPELLPYLAVLGEPSDAELVERWLGSHRDDPALGAASRALGRIGLGRSVPVLLRWLGEVASDEARAVPVAEALDQICGANLRETCMVAPDEGDGEAGEDDEGPAALEEVERTCLDPARWAGWWVEHAPRFHPARGYRRGRPTGALALVHELLHSGLSTTPRRAAQLELFVRTGLRARIHPHWPVAVQRLVLHALRAELEQQESR